MNGLLLNALSSELHKVSDEYINNPVRSIENVSQKLAFGSDYINARFDSFDFLSHFHELPLKLLENFSFDEICKLRFSTAFMMNRTVEEAFETQPHNEVVRKIKNSMWRWGVGKGTWNEVVDVYDGIRNFSLELPSEFELRFDYTTGNNPYGYSKFTRIFIDGVFAFLVYYRKKHVMTVSFSIMENRRLLIQQVQLANPTGNRFLYRLPKPRVELFINLFARSFPSFTLYIIDGKSLAVKTLTDYQSCIKRSREWLERYHEQPESVVSDRLRRDKIDELEELTCRLVHLQKDAPRLAKLYAQCGNYARGTKLVVNKLEHRQLQLTE